jgi:hypothetical protein
MNLADTGIRAVNLLKRTVDHGRYHVARMRFEPPDTEGEHRRIVNGLKQEGACISSLERLGVGNWRELLAEARQIFKEMPANHPNTSDPKSYVIHETPGDLLRHEAIVRFGLEEPILNIIEAYLNLPCAYRGATARRDLANSQVAETRLWHRDDEDRQICKIILYVEDVDENGGGFEYIARSAMPSDFRHYRRVDAMEMAETVPAERWTRVSGTAGTLIFGDTCSIWHRGSLPVSGDRFTIFFGYNSRAPRNPQYCASMVPTELRTSLSATLNERQRRTLLAST